MLGMGNEMELDGMLCVCKDGSTVVGVFDNGDDVGRYL